MSQSLDSALKNAFGDTFRQQFAESEKFEWPDITDAQADKIIATLQKKITVNPKGFIGQLKELYEALMIYTTDTVTLEMHLPSHATKEQVQALADRLKRIEDETYVLLQKYTTQQGHSSDRD